MENVLIAIIGEDRDAADILYKGFHQFPASTLILLVKEKQKKKAEKIARDLERIGVSVEQTLIQQKPGLEDVFLYISRQVQRFSDDALVINVDTDYMTSCLALSSAFVNGIQAMGMLEDDIIVYPVMKFSYYHAINERKMEILKMLYQQGSVASMEELGRLLDMSLPLVAYHLRGNRDSKGLLAMNLVQSSREGGAVTLSLTDLGRLIVNGSVNAVS